MSYLQKLLVIIITIFLFSCQNYIVIDNDRTLELNSDLQDLFGNNINIELIEINIKTENNSYDYTIQENFNDPVFFLTTSKINNGKMKISIDLHYNNKIKSTYSELFINDDINEIGKLYATYQYDRFILKLDTNCSPEINTKDFYNLNVGDHFYKEYCIQNVEELANSYIQTPMDFFYNCNILYDCLDENMVPLFVYPFGAYRNPVFTCNNAFGCYQEYLNTNDVMYLDWFYNNANWLIENRDDNSYLRYEFDFQHALGILSSADWISAMAQGEALAVMCMAYHVSGEERFLEAAHDFFVTMYSNNNEFWSVGIDDEDYLWFEEYPNDDFCHVLNGKLYLIWGLWDYYCLTRNELSLSLLQGALLSIIDNYPIWNHDGVNTSEYCTHSHTGSVYHPVHLNQLAIYGDYFNISMFEDIIIVFTEY